MKTPNVFMNRKLGIICVVLTLCMVMPLAKAEEIKPVSAKSHETYTEYRGQVVDSKSGKPLSFASIVVVGSNISTVSNSDGEYVIKVPKDIENPKVAVSFIGYKNKSVLLASVNEQKPRIELDPVSIQLPEFNVISKDAEVLIKAVMDKRDENYPKEQMLLTAFYRETIKKSRSYVSLSEAVIDVYKQSYESNKSDIVKMYKSRKKADYSKLDTVAFKLMGGPFNSLFLDVMKNPENLFTEDMLGSYEFTFDQTLYQDNRLIYVVDFKQQAHKTDPLYYGKLYIDAKNMALKSAIFNLNIANREAAARMFILKKPFNANVYPTSASYRIDYREKDGKWFYNYSRIKLGMKINWKRKLFNSNYYTTIEMAVTDCEKYTEGKTVESKERLRPTVVISDEASGFSDPDFWGEYNVIEPEKSIESAIRKIQKQLEKEK